MGVGLVLLGVGIWRAGNDDTIVSSPRLLERALADAVPAEQPFRGLTTTSVAVGGRTMRVVVADAADERTMGLRRQRDIGEYDGMLFVFDESTETSFTMSTVPVALDIGFYGPSGRVVDRLRMEPCARSEARCPAYRASGSFVFALETLADELPRGRLRADPGP
jgi:uncharacterized membrane protein (UPF0127 family)